MKSAQSNVEVIFITKFFLGEDVHIFINSGIADSEEKANASYATSLTIEGLNRLSSIKKKGHSYNHLKNNCIIVVMNYGKISNDFSDCAALRPGKKHVDSEDLQLVVRDNNTHSSGTFLKCKIASPLASHFPNSIPEIHLYTAGSTTNDRWAGTMNCEERLRVSINDLVGRSLYDGEIRAVNGKYETNFCFEKELAVVAND